LPGWFRLSGGGTAVVLGGTVVVLVAGTVGGEVVGRGAGVVVEDDGAPPVVDDTPSTGAGGVGEPLGSNSTKYPKRPLMSAARQPITISRGMDTTVHLPALRRVTARSDGEAVSW
jgi:hypothetical protein